EPPSQMKRRILGATFAVASLTTWSAFAQPADTAPPAEPAAEPAAPPAATPPSGGEASGGFQLGLGGGSEISDTGPSDEPNEPGKPKPNPWSLQQSGDNSATTDSVGIRSEERRVGHRKRRGSGW